MTIIKLEFSTDKYFSRMKKWGVVLLIIVIVGALYFIEFSKIESGNESSNLMPTLDQLNFDEAAKIWEDFYKVRATIIDGQNAEFDIPKNLQQAVGAEMEISGAAVFFSPGCKMLGDKIAVHSFYLYPTIGLANACVHLPEVAMRWTIRINLNENWLLTRTEMIDTVVNVKGTFRIDTNKPYESAFFLDNAEVKTIENKEAQF